MSTVTRRAHGESWVRYEADEIAHIDIDSRVHVWRARLDEGAEAFEAILSSEETARAARFHHEEDRRRFIVARGILRTILGDLIASDPSADRRTLRIGQGAAGKPFLIDHPQLHFNVSHSEDLAVIAVTRTGEVGIDVERNRPLRDCGDIGRLVFDDAEKATLLACAPAERDMTFYRLWTRKEALLKASGLGLPALKDPAAASMGHYGAAWCVTPLPHLDGYTGALARPRGAHGIKLWSWRNAIGMRGVERRARPRPLIVTSTLAPRSFELRA